MFVNFEYFLRKQTLSLIIQITIIHYALNHFEIFCEGETTFEVIWYMALCLIINVALLHAIDIGKKS
jgi:hypothetical protein